MIDEWAGDRNMIDERNSNHSDRILVVDDATDNLQLLTHLLTAHGYHVYPASDGELALEFVRSTLPDLILLDIRLPGMDGYEVCRRFKADERTRGIPIIFISAMGDEADKVKGFQAGAVDYIIKPLQAEEVLARVRIHLRLQKLTLQLEQAVRERTDELETTNQLLLQELVERRNTEALLCESEEKYRGLIQRIQAAVIVHGADTRILTSNLRAQQLLGLTQEQMVGKAAIDPAWHFFREDGTTMPVEEYPVNRVLTTGQPFRDVVAGVHRSSTQEDVWVLVSADPVENEQGDIVQVVVTFVDITAHRKAQEDLHRVNRQLRAISTCNQILMQATDEQALLDQICRIVCREAGYRMAWVGYKQNDDHKTIRPMAWAGVEEGYLADAQISWADTAHGRGPTGRAVREGIITCIQDFATDPQAAPWRRNALKHGYRASTALPLKDEEGTPFGALCIYSAEPNTFTPDEIRLLEELAGNLSFGITDQRIRAEHQETERQILASEQLFRALVENSPDFIARYDREFRRIYINPAIQQLFGDQAQNALNNTPADHSPLYAPQVYMDHLRQAIETAAESTAEIPFRTAKGEMRWGHMRFVPEFGPDGQVVSVLAIGRDIHEIKENEKRFRMLAENFPDFVMRLDRDGRYTYVNPTVEKALGLPAAAIVGKTLRELLQDRKPLQIDALQALIRKAFDEGVANESEMVWKTETGERIFDIRHAPEKDAAGNVVSVLAIARDITNRKQAEKELSIYHDHLEELVRERTAELEMANKELDAFAYSVSHDLRAPLRHIDGFVKLLQEKTAAMGDEQGQHYMDLISDSAQKMGVLIDDLLSFSRMSRNTMLIQPLELEPLARDVVRELEPDAAGRTIDWRIGDLPAVEGDAAMLRIALINLVSNALKFTRLRQETRIEIGSLPSQEAETVIYVRDNGVGFDMTYADKLFGVFQRLHRIDEFEGTGIGLATVRRIINKHGGRVWAEAKIDQGARFYFALPHVKGGLSIRQESV